MCGGGAPPPGSALGSTRARVCRLAFAVNGLLQSTGWPGTVKAMTPWLAAAERGRVMGLWSTCYQVGGLAGDGAGDAAASGVGLAPGVLRSRGVDRRRRWRVLLLVCRRAAGRPGPRNSRGLGRCAGPSAGVEPGRRLLLSQADPLQPALLAAFFLHSSSAIRKTAGLSVASRSRLGGVLGAVSAGRLSDRLPRGPVLVAMGLGLAGSLLLYGRVASHRPAGQLRLDGAGRLHVVRPRRAGVAIRRCRCCLVRLRSCSAGRAFPACRPIRPARLSAPVPDAGPVRQQLRRV